MMATFLSFTSAKMSKLLFYKSFFKLTFKHVNLPFLPSSSIHVGPPNLFLTEYGLPLAVISELKSSFCELHLLLITSLVTMGFSSMSSLDLIVLIKLSPDLTSCYPIYLLIKCIFPLSGESEVSVKSGDISIGSTSGILKAVTNTGNIDISLSQHNNVILETKEGKLP